MGYHSSSDDYYSTSKSSRKHSKRSRRRSRSSSSDRSRDHKRRRKDRRSRRRSRSSSASSRDSRDRHSRKSHKSHKKTHQVKKSSDAVFGKKTGTMMDVFDIEPGFSKMTPAEQAKVRVRRALESASKTKSDITEEQLLDKVIDKSKDADIKSQISRHQQISKIENFSDNEEFVPSSFKSKSKPAESKYKQRENTHELAIFGHSSVKISADQSLSRIEAVRRKKREDEEALLKAKDFVDFMSRDFKSIVSDKFRREEDKINSDWFLKIKQLKVELNNV